MFGRNRRFDLLSDTMCSMELGSSALREESSIYKGCFRR